MAMLSRWIPGQWKQALKTKLGVPDVFWSIRNLEKNGFRPRRIIDIGAYQGERTRDTLKIFPDAHFLMMEAQATKKTFLAELTGIHPARVQYSLSLLGAENGTEEPFHEVEMASSVLQEHHDTPATDSKKRTVRPDTLTEELDLEAAGFLKLDTQGYKLAILRGGERTLAHAEVVLTEVSLLDVHQHVPLVRDVLNFMGDRGFQAYDIRSSTRRPLDNALWQTHVIFVRTGSALLADKRCAGSL